MSIIGEVLVHYRRHGALYSIIRLRPGSLPRNIRRHKSVISPSSSSPTQSPWCSPLSHSHHSPVHLNSQASRPGPQSKIFYFKSISCCDQTDQPIAHFVKLWLGFRSLCSPRCSPKCPLPRYCLLCLDIYDNKNSLDAVVPGPRRHQSGAFCAMDSQMEWHGGINHDCSVSI